MKLKILFSTCQTLRYEQCHRTRRSFADAQESLFRLQNSKILAVRNEGVSIYSCSLNAFSDCKNLDMCSAVMQARRIADNQDHVLRLRNVHIGAVTSCIWSIF
jgi:hypothetical protein